MADATVATGAAAGGHTISRPGGASGSPRVGALRPVSAVAPTSQSFTQAFAVTRQGDEEPSAPISVEPGIGRLSSSVQLILAETRTKEEQSDFIDRSILDQATLSYAQSQEAVRETIGFTKLAAAGSEAQPAGALIHAEDTSA